MAAPGVDHPIVLRRFEGTNILVDGAYLGPTYLRRSQNWVPGDTFRIEKRPGSRNYEGGNFGVTVTRCQALRATTNATDRLLFAVVTEGGVDTVLVSVNGGPWMPVLGDATFGAVGSRYDMEVMNQVLYVGNGVDPIKRIPLGTLTAVNMAAVTAFTDTGGTPTLNDDSGGQLLTGTYSYCWCIFDHTNAVWVERGSTLEFTKRTAGDQNVSIPFPVGFTSTLGAQFKAHLFVTPVDYPIEFAHDQTTEGLLSDPVILRQVVADGPPVPLRGPARVGRMFRSYRGRLITSGDQATPEAVWCSSVVAPGNEQAIFNAGVFWPHNGRLPRAPEAITGIGLASSGERENSIDSPLVFTTLTRTYLWFGDVLDDPSATVQLVSKRAGCISAASMVETPIGLFYCGLDSVYMIPAGGGVPQDVGWPIRPAILAIPSGVRQNVIALYHKGFYKLAIVPAGQVTATQQWWLDIRRGIQQVPSWWGPHVGVAPSAWTTSAFDTIETDIGFHGVENTNVVERIHQKNSYREENGQRILVSVFTSGDLDEGMPFDRKTGTWLRAIGFPNATTSVAARLVHANGATTIMDPLVFRGTEGAIWNVSRWNLAHWGQSGRSTEAQSIMDELRPRARSFAIQLTHAEAVGLGIRDIEFRYLPTPRATRSVDADPDS